MGGEAEGRERDADNGGAGAAAGRRCQQTVQDPARAEPTGEHASFGAD